ncbi:iron-siderophore ABC transporter substrate-binding protein [Streptomonospora wellingtoniae]|uniref:Iron-siderophore ABC transporter substrate-binding protein n=1 Tax=Streptomonospora wellingtoniae TaxID=3075544 RepID=A0ABU2KVD0_9ACTN|nr:iron-siderophore ABC transporter substrate-binding protein [Streptomonospora sp. DSM 45055]MDT0303213.1 iron-siderophore ABC transporter substrate-binding protein [Streptomonospora sp. DSM 45055]
MAPTARPRTTARMLATASAAAVLTLATACGSDAGGGDASQGQDGGSEGFPVTVEHAMGETRIEQRPETVVVLDTSYLDSAVGLQAEVVGRTAYSDGGGLRDYLGGEGRTYAGDAEVVGTLEAPDLAKIAELGPDLILSAKVRHEDVYDQLSKIAPTVFSETTGATWKQNHLLAGEALGKEDMAEKQIAGYEERAASLGEAVAEENGGEMPTMTLARFAGEPTVRLYGPESFPGIIQKDVGLPRPGGAPMPEDGGIAANLAPEEILDLDADHIMVSTWDDGSGEAAEKAEDFTSNPLWDQLEGEKHEVSDEVWLTSVSVQGADAVLDDMAGVFGVQAP